MDHPGPEGDVTPTVQQLSSESFQTGRAALIPNSSQGITSPHPGASRSNPNMPAFYTTIRRKDGTWVEARAIVDSGSKKIGIIEDFADYLDLYCVDLPENKKRCIPIGPAPTDQLYAISSTKVRIRNRYSTDPSEEPEMPAIVWRPDTSGPPEYDIRIPPRFREKSYELRHEGM